MNHPTAPCSPPRANSSRSFGARLRSIRAVAHSQMSGTMNASPIRRPHSRCVHSSQKMCLKPASPKSWLTRLY